MVVAEEISLTPGGTRDLLAWFNHHYRTTATSDLVVNRLERTCEEEWRYPVRGSGFIARRQGGTYRQPLAATWIRRGFTAANTA